MLYYLTPISSLHTGFPSPAAYDRVYPHSVEYYPGPSFHIGSPRGNYYNSYTDVEAEVELAARRYALAQRRAEGLRLRRAEQARRLEQQQLEQILREQQRQEYIREQHRREQRQRAEAEALSRLAAARAAIAKQRRVEELRAQAAAFHRQQLLARGQFGLYLQPTEDPASEGPSKPKVQSGATRSPATPEDLLRSRLRSGADPEIQELIEDILASVFNTSVSPKSQPTEAPVKKDKGKARETPAVPFPWSKPADVKAESKEKKTVHFDPPVPSSTSPDAPGADLHRRPAMKSPTRTATELSLGAIDRVSALLHELKTTFVFPTELDYSSARSPSPTPSDDESSLPFTLRNKPVHAYQHALNGLLSKLDEIESYGDEEIRRRRKEAVIEIEGALEDVDKKVANASPKLQTIPLEPVPASTGSLEQDIITNDATVEAPADITAPGQAPDDADTTVAHQELELVPADEQLRDARPTDQIASPRAVSGSSQELPEPTSSTHDSVDISSSVVDSSLPAESESLPPVPTIPAAVDTPAAPTEPNESIVSASEVSLALGGILSDPAAHDVELTANTEAKEPTLTTLVDPVPETKPETEANVPTTLPEADAPVADNDLLRTPSEDAFLLQDAPHADDASYVRAKTRAATNKEEHEGEWEDAEIAISEGEEWSELE